MDEHALHRRTLRHAAHEIEAMLGVVVVRAGGGQHALEVTERHAAREHVGVQAIDDRVGLRIVAVD